jgi:predicted GNAT family acetyltransferase
MEHWDDEAQAMLLRDKPAGRSLSVMIARDVQLRSEWEVIISLPLYQMVCTQFRRHEVDASMIRVMEAAEIPSMLDLTSRTKPGPFFERTIEMGRYFGLFEGNTLASMAGERLQLPGYTEVSAICTEPSFLGKGYASAVTSVVCEQIINEGITPFLHVRNDNTRAINVYQKLGFEVRADVFFAVIR